MADKRESEGHGRNGYAVGQLDTLITGLLFPIDRQIQDTISVIRTAKIKNDLVRLGMVFLK